MRIDVVTIFPDILRGPLTESLLGRAIERGLVEVGFVDPRDFTEDRHRQVDDEPFGGGPGMVMRPEPWFAAVESIEGWERARRILLTPAGRRFDQRAAEELSASRHVIIKIGRAHV